MLCVGRPGGRASVGAGSEGEYSPRTDLKLRIYGTRRKMHRVSFAVQLGMGVPPYDCQAPLPLRYEPPSFSLRQGPLDRPNFTRRPEMMIGPSPIYLSTSHEWLLGLDTPCVIWRRLAAEYANECKTSSFVHSLFK